MALGFGIGDAGERREEKIAGIFDEKGASAEGFEVARTNSVSPSRIMPVST